MRNGRTQFAPTTEDKYYIYQTNPGLYNSNENTGKMETRKQNRLKEYDYSQNGFYFITICTADRQKIKSLKILVTKTIGKPIFQRSFYDHVIRDEKDYLRIWEYIENNPGKWTDDKYFI